MNRVAIDGRTRLIGLIGWPIGSYSPVELYNAAFHASELNWRCVPLPVAKGQLRAALLGLRALGFAGAEVMEPYQRDAVACVDKLSPAAETTGVVDLVRVDACGRLVGDNVQWLGFLATLRTLVPSLNGLRPLVIGSGTGARSVVYALTHEGLPVTIVDECIGQAIELVRRLRHVLHEHSFSVYRFPQDLDRVASDVNLIINASNLDMWPDPNHSLWPVQVPFPEDALVFDLAPWHSETRFLQQARRSGATTANGLSVLLNASAAAFERWTGQRAEIDAMWHAVVDGGVRESPQDLPWPRDMAFAQLT